MMRLYLVPAAAILLAGSVTPSAGQQPASEAARKEILAFADEFDRAQLTKDAAALDRMVSPDLVFIDGSGKRGGKKEFIEGWTAPGDAYDPISLIDRIVVPLGPEAAIVGAETTLSGTSDGKRFSSRFRFADTFRRTGGRWRAVHIQVTRLPEQASSPQ